jgi:hypothetical protein
MTTFAGLSNEMLAEKPGRSCDANAHEVDQSSFHGICTD